MEIYKIIAEKVCHAICHMNYNIVVHQAKMKDEDTFTFTISDGNDVDVEFWSEKYVIYIDGEFLISDEWKTNMSVDGIADEIIGNIRYR